LCTYGSWLFEVPFSLRMFLFFWKFILKIVNFGGIFF
jgi:hypothetical protein